MLREFSETCRQKTEVERKVEFCNVFIEVLTLTRKK